MISADLSAAVSEALAAAGIPPERCGSARTDGLTDAERQLYRWVLQHVVEQERASSEDLRVQQACTHGLDPATTADVLAREDLVTSTTREKSSSPIRSPGVRRATP